MHNLDKYSHIAYRDTTHKYWHRFPFKVVVVNENGKRRPPSTTSLAAANVYSFTSGQGWKEYIHNREARRKQRTTYIRSFAAYLPDSDVCLTLNATHTVNFFFVNEADTANFIDQVQEKVLEVWRPASVAHVAVMADHKVIVRKSLFLERYPWRVTFKINNKQQREDFFEWEALYFRDETDERDEARSHLSVGVQVRLYLRDETDVIFTKLGTSDIIDRIEKVILVSEVENAIHEAQFDAKIS